VWIPDDADHRSDSYPACDRHQLVILIDIIFGTPIGIVRVWRGPSQPWYAGVGYLQSSGTFTTVMPMKARTGPDARRAPRYPLRGAVQLSWQLSSGETHIARATFVDVSDRGARVECTELLAARSNVYLQAPSYGQMGNATVRYCRRQGLKYSIGLEFTWAAALAEEGRKRVAQET